MAVATLGLLVGVALAAHEARAQVLYRYVDERGVVHFTDAPADSRYEAVVHTPKGLRSARVLGVRAPANDTYDQLIRREASSQSLHPALVKAVIAAESNFRSGAVSRAGALGLMQLMPTTAAALGVRDPLRPEENVSGGVRYLRVLLNRYGDLTRTLAAYNAGPEAVDRYGGIPPYPETQAYVDRVLHYYRRYHADFRE